MASGTSDPEVKKKAIKSGAFGYLSKPVDLERLLKMVKEAFG